MAKKLTYERYAWFHGRVKAGAFPNSAHLADHFEISRKQAQRDVAFMRDRIGAPLLYNAERRGYRDKELRATIREEIRKMGTLYR
jgi:hypothetical protein